jgi:hypothetical protein
VPFWQTPLTQSAPSSQPWPVPQSGHVLPQSTSVSLPFSTKSVHVGAWHVPPLHTALAQSPLPLQIWFEPHFGHPPPPQSTSVSVPFLVLSEHVGGWQTVPLQRLL